MKEHKTTDYHGTKPCICHLLNGLAVTREREFIVVWEELTESPIPLCEIYTNINNELI